MLIIDSQIHLWDGGQAPPHHRQAPYLAEEALADMTAAGVDAAINHPPGWDSDSNRYAIEAAGPGGSVELSVGSGRRRAVVHLLRPGDVDGDIQMLLGRDLPYTGRVLSGATCLFLGRGISSTCSPPACRWRGDGCTSARRLCSADGSEVTGPVPLVPHWQMMARKGAQCGRRKL